MENKGCKNCYYVVSDYNHRWNFTIHFCGHKSNVAVERRWDEDHESCKKSCQTLNKKRRCKNFRERFESGCDKSDNPYEPCNEYNLGAFSKAIASKLSESQANKDKQKPSPEREGNGK